MLCVFLDETGKIMLTYPNISLNVGDYVCIRKIEYKVTKKRLNTDAKCYEYWIARQ